MATGTITSPFEVKDITSSFTKSSDTDSLQALKIGNIILVRAVCGRTASTADWTICEIPQQYRPSDGRWVGTAFLSGKSAGVCTIRGSTWEVYVSSPHGDTSMNWCLIEIIWVLGTTPFS